MTVDGPDHRRPALRILVVDDAPFVRTVLERLLAAAGHHCTGAEDGHTALAAAATDRFDVIVIDHEMPGLDGCRVVERLRDGDSPNWATPVVLISGHAGDDLLAARAADVGIDAVLGKPIDAAEVLRTIGRLVVPPPAADRR